MTAREMPASARPHRDSVAGCAKNPQFSVQNSDDGVFCEKYMIKLRQPSVVLHSDDVPGYKYRMWQTWKMPRGASASDVVYWINWAIDRSPEMELHNVLINCHGGPGTLYVGGAGNGGKTITAPDLGIFKNVRRGSLGTIYIVACEVTKNDGTNPLGKDFCRQLAINAECFVVAADAIQSVDFWYQV